MAEAKSGTGTRARWLSREFSELVAAAADGSLTADVVIVGSGYGGAVAAAELAGCTNEHGQALSVCVLERGKEYLPGMFPSRMSELPMHLRCATPGSGKPAKMREGLFDLRPGADVSVILANGLGGGSLINAGVMEKPEPEVFDARWPENLHQGEALQAFYADARSRIGAVDRGRPNTIDEHPGKPLQKLAAFDRLAPGRKSRRAEITIAMRAGRKTEAEVELKTCKRCGDCATGCNYEAKESLDTNLLAQAVRKGAKLYTGVTVLHLSRDSASDGWVLHTVYTDPQLSERQGGVVKIRARRVILAAGALGSTEILLRSQRAGEGLSFSPQLGRRFSTNGDMIVAGYGQKGGSVNAVAEESQPPEARGVGPSITGIIDVKNEATGRREMVLEELAVPGPLRRLFEEVYTTAHSLRRLEAADLDCHDRSVHPARDPFAVNPGELDRTQLYAAMGDDGADGVMRLQPFKDEFLCDGALKIEWKEVRTHPLFGAQVRKFEALAKAAQLGGTTIANPLWQPLPKNMQDLIGEGARGPLLTVHPLGGCAMADDSGRGVVNEFGEVFDAHPGKPAGAIYDGLAVLDGAIVPSALGTNPALTITALALRAVKELRRRWGLVAAAGAMQPLMERFAYRDAEKEIIARGKPTPTEGAFTERLNGKVCLRDASGMAKTYMAELTLHYRNKPLRELVSADASGRLDNAVLVLGDSSTEPNAEISTLRVFDEELWQKACDRSRNHDDREKALDREALLIAPLTGSLTIMRRETSSVCRRTTRAAWAWVRNRGLRDLWQAGETYLNNLADGVENKGPGFGSRIWRGLKMATHAGGVRLFEYELQIGAPSHRAKDFFWEALPGAALKGEKRITYARPSNPWRQMMEMTVTEMPHLVTRSARSVLALDNRYMAARGTPLFRIVKQEDHVAALADVASLAAYILRMVLGIHLWSLRLPDPPNPAEPQRLPGAVPGLPAPEFSELKVDEHEGKPVVIRLTRYRGANDAAIPVLMIHGYSASGNTFAHPAPPCDIARYLHRAGRDIWIVDLRTSCGLPTAEVPWSMERVGLVDVPAAVDYVHRATGGKKMDVIAHCMGSVMFSMAVLSANKTKDEVCSEWDKWLFRDAFAAARKELPDRVRKAVLSQIGPLMVFSPRNVFSSYVMGYLRYFVPLDNYRFRPSASPGLAEQLMDRLLATLPYPDDEFKLENPAWPPWCKVRYAGTRHRMDALYGQDFKLANLDRRTLDCIDDYFGPLNAETVTQVIHFTRLQMITNRFGRNRFVSRKALRDHWKFPTLSIHGEENGLSDKATLTRMDEILRKDARRDFIPKPIEGFGHQDCWIGTDAESRVFRAVLDFLDAPEPEQPSVHATLSSLPGVSGITDADAMGRDSLLARIPWAGPVMGLPPGAPSAAGLRLSLSGDPELGHPSYVALLPVREDGKGRVMPIAGVPLVHGALKILDTGAALDNDWFGIEVDTALFVHPEQGVLVLCIYDQPKALSAGTHLEPMANPLPGFPGVRVSPTPSTAVPERAIYAAVNQLLKEQDLGQLCPGIVCMPGAPSEAGPRTLVLGSCQYPNGLLDGDPAYEAYERLGRRLDRREIAPQALILTGDQIYADATAGLFDPTHIQDNVRRAYERWLHKRPVRQVTRRVPMIAMLDDHEMTDNWEPIGPKPDPNRREDRQAALGAYYYAKYQRGALPLLKVGLWVPLEVAGLPLFLADTRTERERRTAKTFGAARLMSDLQLDALKNWLLDREDKYAGLPRLVVAPSILLPRHGVAAGDGSNALRSDGWDGYQRTMAEVLGVIAEHGIQRVVFLSGNEHIGCAASATLTRKDKSGQPVLIHSIHTSALYAPYPFADAHEADLISEDSFEFAHGGTDYLCDVGPARFFPGCGFTLLNFTRERATWRLHCEFNREGIQSSCFECDLS